MNLRKDHLHFYFVLIQCWAYVNYEYTLCTYCSGVYAYTCIDGGGCVYMNTKIQVMKAAMLVCSINDSLAQVLMKDAAKCDGHCELQFSVNKLGSDRIVWF